MTKHSMIKDSLVMLAAKSGGATLQAMATHTGRTQAELGRLITELEGGKRIFRATRAGMKVRFFANEARRYEWVMAQAKCTNHNTVSPKLHSPKVRIKGTPTRGLGILLPGSDAYVDPGRLAAGEQRAQREASAGFVALGSERFGCRPGDKVPAVFSSLKPGQYSEPASGWAAAVSGVA